MRFQYTLYFALVITVLFRSENSEASAERAILGSCAGFKIPVTSDGEVDWIGSVRVLRERTPVFTNGQNKKSITKLAFGRALEVVGVGDDRLRVQMLSDEKALGWIKRSDLLCSDTPLRGEAGLEQKLYIKTATAVQGETPKTVRAYPSPSDNSCQSKCRELSRFTGYFIFAIDKKNERYLLADNYLLEETSTLVGWVGKSDGFIWETAYGLRPREDLKYHAGHEKAGQERSMCLYSTISDAKSKKNCMPLLGGDRWYNYADRVPILGREGKYYRVIVPLAGTGIKKRGKGEIVIAPEVMGRSIKAIDSLENLKRMDIFFLIDGTRSMQPYIDIIRGSERGAGVVQKIIAAFGTDDAFRDTKLRFGFRVYRDTYAGNSGLGESLPFNSTCDVSANSLRTNLDNFAEKISKVQASASDAASGDNDYEENLLGGIAQAMDDMLPCPDNSKILFVIGDHGYNGEAQRARGAKVIDINALANSMTGDKGRGEKTIVPFFIQTPNNGSYAKNPLAYQNAYAAFRRQARAIASVILGAGRQAETKTIVLTSDDSRLTEKIITGVKLFGDSRVVNEIIADIQGGTPLVEAITRLQGAREFRNLPGLFWDIVEQGSCKALGKQCTERIYETVFEGFAEVSDDVTVDVWLKSDDLQRWVSLLNLMQDVRQYGGKEQRMAFVQALVDTLQNVIGKPLYEDTNETLRDYLERKGGLPVRDNSPLIKYSLASLMDPKKVPNCEILRLAAWVQNAKQMLAIVNKGDRRPVFSSENYPGECPGGKNIPFIDGDIGQRPLGADDKMSYSHPFQKARVFWVPKNFLP
jgi:hypothetical protein